MKSTHWMMKHAAVAVAAVSIAGGLGSGCVMPPAGGGSGTPSSVDPEPNGYYTGDSHDFAARANPDPLGRKFQVGYLRVHFMPTDVAPDMARLREENPLAGAPTVEELKQIVGETLAMYLSPDTVSAMKSMYANMPAWAVKPRIFPTIDGEAAPRLPGAQRAIFGESIWQCGMDVNRLNGELEKRYPHLFTTGGNGFPLALAMVGLYSSQNPDIRTCYEAWVIGVPEDGEWVRPLRATEAFIDAYEACAAAVLALTEDQFEGVERAEFGRRIWQY